MPWRVDWRLDVILPVLVVLVNGFVVLLLVTLTLESSARHQVRVVAIAGAVVIFGVIVAVMSFLLQHPLRELQEKIARVRQGDLNVSVSFANRNDDIGDLGRDFNEMIR